MLIVSCNIMPEGFLYLISVNSIHFPPHPPHPTTHTHTHSTHTCVCAVVAGGVYNTFNVISNITRKSPYLIGTNLSFKLLLPHTIDHKLYKHFHVGKL